MKTILILALVGFINAEITSYEFKSVDFDSKITWKGDGLYNISVKNYGKKEWERVYTNVSEGTHDVSKFIAANFHSFWIKFEQNDYSTERYDTGLCYLMKFRQPYLKLEAHDDHIHFHLDHPFAVINGEKRPIFRDQELCGLILFYTVNFTFGRSPIPISYKIDYMDCDSSGCDIDFFTTEKVCVEHSHNKWYNDASIPKKVCVSPKKKVYTCAVSNVNYLQHGFKKKVDRIIDRKYSKKEGTFMKTLAGNTINNFKTILDLE
ncbi:soluble interferon-gamma receptor-like protein [Murmansk poxvirus]|uniref:Soluble interferon-gamma receptor-like protein n=1 Tax=Murmansk poxvirus TaxID=2025359 RepID=A0A223FN04_9POXV|nr:soluble interferon-gamma receptor-like protein [Murmansk poxvirus]AST09376.1 soluble interferon-gamma receptor-like protein [Murmansk poxvirus]